MSPHPRTGVLISRGKFGHRHQENIPRDDRGRDWSSAVTRQGMARIADRCQKVGEKPGMDSPSELLRRN